MGKNGQTYIRATFVGEASCLLRVRGLNGVRRDD